MKINQFGWNVFFEQTFKNNFNDEFLPGRIIACLPTSYKVVTQNGEVQMNRLEKLINEKKFVVGDFVVLKKEYDQIVIHKVLPRVSNYPSGEDVLAANLDTIFIVNALDHLDTRKIEKTVIKVWESGATPVVILTKQDLCENYHKKVAEVRLACPGVDVYAVSSVTGFGMLDLSKYFKEGKTIALLGSIGEGKSQLLKKLFDEEVKEYELKLVSSGSIIIDLDEERELNLNINESDTFNDIEELILNCKFNNCTHLIEPGCAVKKAVEEGKLNQSRLNEFLKLQKRESFELVEEDLRFEYKRKSKEPSFTKAKRKEQW